MIDNAVLAVPEVAGVAGKIAQAVEEEVLARHTAPLILSSSLQGTGLRTASSPLSEVLHVPQGNGPPTDRRVAHSEGEEEN